MARLLFVCTGNTCRSPLAAARARLIAAEQGLEIDVDSAGISAVDGTPASGHAQFVARDAGGDLAAHRSHGLDSAQLESADLVLVMTTGHRDTIRRGWPQYADLVVTLGEAAGLDQEVNDPWGGTLEEYESVERRMTALIEAAWPMITRRLGL